MRNVQLCFGWDNLKWFAYQGAVAQWVSHFAASFAPEEAVGSSRRTGGRGA